MTSLKTMKTVLAIVMTFILTCAAHAQGVFNGNTGSGGPSAKCYEYIPGIPGVVALSSTSMGQWFVGAAGTTDENALIATGPTKTFTSGYCQVGAITTTFAPGSTITVQFRAWKGASSWDAAQTTAGAIWGESYLIQVSGLVTGTALPPTVAIQGFTLALIPEPSTIALSLLGISILFLRRHPRHPNRSL